MRVIVELGANDMLRGHRSRGDAPGARRDRAPAGRTAASPVLLAGMRAAPNLGADYAQRFEAIYPELAAKYDVLFYPFFLDGIAADAKLNQRDGIHPTAAGVDAIVAPHPAEGRGTGGARPRERRGS